MQRLHGKLASKSEFKETKFETFGNEDLFILRFLQNDKRIKVRGRELRSQNGLSFLSLETNHQLQRGKIHISANIYF